MSLKLPYSPTGKEYFKKSIYGTGKQKMPLKFQMIALLYLIEKHPNVCVYVPNIQEELKDNTPSTLSLGAQFWIKTQKLYWPTLPNFWTPKKNPKKIGFFDKCMKNSARFIIVQLILEADEGMKMDNHANLLVYDKNENTFERFEPLGVSLPAKYHGNILDKALGRVCKERGITYVAPNQFCPIPFGIQVIQHEEFLKMDKPVKGDIGGWCQSWSLFYADMRMAYPDVPRDVLLNDAVALFKNKSMTTYIRDYTYYIAKRSTQIKNINDYKKMALKAVEKYKYYNQ